MIKKIIKFLKNKNNYSNHYYIKYHLYKAFNKLGRRLGLIEETKNNRDTFNWTLYNLHYRGEMIDNEKVNTIKLKAGDYIFNANGLTKNNSSIKPLHENWRLIYETILELQPNSVFELGVGNGMHLNNIQLLAPELKLSGIDLSAEQIKYLRNLYPNLRAEIKQADATIPWSENFMPKADLAFTQAVIMHIHTKDLHKIALTNLFNISNKYVILMERWKNHNIMEDIKNLKAEGKIKWENLYFYYKISRESNEPHLMICSKQKLSYNELTNYNIFAKN